MKKLFSATVFFLLIISCSKNKYQVFEGFAQGTTFRIVYQSPEIYEDTIKGLLKYFDETLSLYQENSMISRINRNDSIIELNDLFIDFFRQSRKVFEQSGGYFDITVAPLVEIWGFGPKENIKADSTKIDSLLEFVGMDKIKLNGKKLIKSDVRARLDGNAIAQGQSVDYIADFFENQGIVNYLVEIGGEVRAKGVNEKGQSWRIGIDKPIEGSDEQNRELQAIIQLKDKSLATSGNYRKFHLIDGVKYTHSINPKTGHPAKDILLSVTIISDKCSLADGYATACMVMGFEKAKQFISGMEEVDAYFIYSGNDGQLKIYLSPGFEKYLAK